MCTRAVPPAYGPPAGAVRSSCRERKSTPVSYHFEPLIARFSPPFCLLLQEDLGRTPKGDFTKAVDSMTQ